MEILTIILVLMGAILVILAYIVGTKIGELRREKFWIEEVGRQREDALKRSRAVLKGQVGEQMAPYFPDFPFNAGECRFIGKPVDFIVFHGINEKEVDKIIFVEVKTGDAKLTDIERKIKNAIDEGRVFWEEYRL